MRPTCTVLSIFALLFAASSGSAKGKAPRMAESPAQATQAGQAAPSPLLGALQEELNREMAVIGKADPPAYFLSYTVTNSDRSEVTGSNGALLSSQEQRSRWLEGQVRVGSYQLDNTHRVGNDGPGFPGSFGEPVPIDDDPAVLKRAMWRETESQYRAAAEAFIKVKTGKDVQVQTVAQGAPDFSQEKAQIYYGPRASYTLDRHPWEEKVRLYTHSFRASAAVLNSIVTFRAEAHNQYQVTSEGTKVQFGEIRYRLELFIQGKASDGMDLERYYNFDWTDPASAPDDKTVLAQCAVLQKELESLVQAPLAEPYAGPAMLTGRAAAVFFHEVFGHRDEGFRQKDIGEGQTFAGKVGELLLPKFISIIDDPTAGKLGSTVLLGNYPFDDEGIASQKVTLVDHGVLRNFEMSRQPLNGFPQSNGHGRRQVGLPPESRQGNLIVESSYKVANARLRQMFIEEIKRQNKPYGLFFDDISGGFTFTGRSQPQAFQVEPLVVYRVYADGRPDELVRGVAIVGTPLVSLQKIMATGDTTEVFNGYCGAESGSVPVAAAAPPLLISEMEVQKKQTSTDRPPILPPPAHDPQANDPQTKVN
ncbi:MAG TPA: metallopeptidase TldD-related protein [Rugosimonospora sp.]|nr:metallopeptidase TldD-related protein [Rugosimonospora sp.]